MLGIVETGASTCRFDVPPGTRWKVLIRFRSVCVWNGATQQRRLLARFVSSSTIAFGAMETTPRGLKRWQ